MSAIVRIFVLYVDDVDDELSSILASYVVADAVPCLRLLLRILHVVAGDVLAIRVALVFLVADVVKHLCYSVDVMKTWHYGQNAKGSDVATGNSCLTNSVVPALDVVFLVATL